jgi:NhaA family Na+:H+ antiporter
MADEKSFSGSLRLLRAVDPRRDHLRGAPAGGGVEVVSYMDFLCPYCRRLRQVMNRLRQSVGDRVVYVFRYFPNERANPGAELAARAAEAAGRQGRFFEMHDRLFEREPPIGDADLRELARNIGLDLDRFEEDLASDDVRARVLQDLDEGRKNGVTGTPTLFIDGLRYDGAWDYHSLLETLERPIARRVHRSARVFASLPTSAGLVLLVAAVVALLFANTPLAPFYERVMSAPIALGPVSGPLTLTTREWLAEGLLSIFFLLVGLEIRREMTNGALTSWRAALLPIVAAFGGVVAPALIYLALNHGASSQGWAIPTATDVAFSLGLLAVLGDRIPIGLRVFVAALAVVDDVLSVLTLAIFFRTSFAPAYALAVLGSIVVLAALNRARVYSAWPYAVTGIGLWLSLHAFGVDAALAGVLLAMFLPNRPPPAAAPLLAQAATALTALDQAEKEAHDDPEREARIQGEPVWEWAARNLSAASDRLSSPAERIEAAVAPWSAYAILPAFALSATGVRVAIDFSANDAKAIFAGVVVGLVIGKPVGILVASGLALVSRLAVGPEGVTTRQFVGAACLCGVGDTVALLMADRAFSGPSSSTAKLAVLTGSVIAGSLGMLVLRRRAVAATRAS